MFTRSHSIAIGTLVTITDSLHHTTVIRATQYKGSQIVAARINDEIPLWNASTSLTFRWPHPEGMAQQSGKIITRSDDFLQWALQGPLEVTNRRQFPRYDVKLPCAFGYPNINAVGMTVDISEGGLQWQSPDKRWRLKDSVLIRLDLPGGSILSSVRILRVQPLKIIDAMRYAGDFHAMGSGEHRALVRFLQHPVIGQL